MSRKSVGLALVLAGGLSAWPPPAAHAQGGSSVESGTQVVVGQSSEGFATVAAMPDKIGSEILAHRQEKVRLRGLPEQERVARYMRLGLNPNNPEAEDCALSVHRRLTGQEIQTLSAQGIAVNAWLWVPPVPGKHPFGFHLARVSYTSLDLIRNDRRFVRLESTEFAHHPNNDLGGAMINVDDVHSGNGVRARDGTGVRIAIADSGLDLTHADIPVPVEAFDVTDGRDPTTWGTDVSNTVIHHGTHVTGTAVGDGSLSGGRYTGSAPGADLYFYKIGNDENGYASTDDIIEAINRAQTVGCDIFSMSYGGYSEYMDGSSPEARAVDAAVAGGMVVFISAGNEGNADRHYSVDVAAQTTSPVFGFTIYNSADNQAYTDDEEIRVLWRDNAPTDANLTLACTNLGPGETLVQVSSETSTRNTEGKSYMLTPNVPASSSNAYDFTLTNNATTGSTPLVHLYVVDGIGTFDTPDSTHTIGDPALADSAIAVGAWTHRVSWTDYQGNIQNYPDPAAVVNTLAPFSSLGPRIDGLMKPDIVAPGLAIISTRDSVAGLADDDSRIIDNDGLNLDGSGPANYYVDAGTSMACPMAAGAAALLLEANPTWTPLQVRDRLTSTASMATSPNNEVGCGLIDILAALTVGCQWVPGEGIPGLDDYVFALTVWDPDGGGPEPELLVAGGGFTIAGDVLANNVAAWDGTTWAPLDSGMNTSVARLAVYNGELIAAGWFTTAGGVSANYIARWNGSSWAPLDSGMDNIVAALTVYGGELIAGGYFGTAGGVNAYRIARWDGTRWAPLGSGLVGPEVAALTVYNGELIAGGWFRITGSVNANYIAGWDGTSWAPLGSGMDDSVWAFTVYNNELIAGGNFTTAGGVSANYIARWNGTRWAPLGSGMNDAVRDLTVYNGELIAGGRFTTAGGVSASRIARWDGTSWAPLGSGMGGGQRYDHVEALTVYNGELIAGGWFTTAGGNASDFWARWFCAEPARDADFDGDQDVDGDDFAHFVQCFTGPGGQLAPDCDPGDFDGDGDVDLADTASFQRAFTGPP